MGYTTNFYGSIQVTPPLDEAEVLYLQKFGMTRRMNRANGPYFVHGTGYFGQGDDPDVLDHNVPPEGQPNLWCQWVPTIDGSAIEWNGMEKFYDAADWMKYIIEHFVGSQPRAIGTLPFLKPHSLTGRIFAQGEEPEDRWTLCVVDNVVFVIQAEVVECGHE